MCHISLPEFPGFNLFIVIEKSGRGCLEKKTRCVVRESLEASRVPLLKFARISALWVVALLSSS
jgi:hypothetical protein